MIRRYHSLEPFRLSLSVRTVDSIRIGSFVHVGSCPTLSDLSDAQWAFIELLELDKHWASGRRMQLELKAMVNAIFYVCAAVVRGAMSQRAIRITTVCIITAINGVGVAAGNG